MIAEQSLGILRRNVRAQRKTLCVRLAVILLFAILPLAEADSPDSLWVSGLYNGADLDDLIAALIAATAVIARSDRLLVGPPVIAADAVLLADQGSLPRPSPPARPVRAPPVVTYSAVSA